MYNCIGQVPLCYLANKLHFSELTLCTCQCVCILGCMCIYVCHVHMHTYFQTHECKELIADKKGNSENSQLKAGIFMSSIVEHNLHNET